MKDKALAHLKVAGYQNRPRPNKLAAYRNTNRMQTIAIHEQ